jgi:hypothetical protein
MISDEKAISRSLDNEIFRRYETGPSATQSFIAVQTLATEGDERVMPAGIGEFTANSPARSDGGLDALGNLRLADCPGDGLVRDR